MLALLSPAKKLDLDPLAATRLKLPLTEPALLSDAATLAATAKKLPARDLGALMDLSEALAELNWDRFQVWKKAHALGHNHAKPAILSFAGDVYAGLEASTLTNADLVWMNDRVRILSGLYGLLRPLDLMQPYRLEMGSKLQTRKGSDLYAYWGDKLARALTTQLGATPAPHRAVINLASNEYMKAVPKAALKPVGQARSARPSAPLEARVIDVTFKEVKAGKPVTLMLFAKRARGMMVRYMTTHRVDRPEGLKDFDLGDYRFDAAGSTADAWVFSRPYRTAAMSADD